MSTLYIVLPASLALALAAVLAFRWATRRGQYDDLETPAWRAILDDAPAAGRPPVAPPGPAPERR